MAAIEPSYRVSAGALTGLPDDVAAAMADPPLWDKRFLELAVRWPDASADTPAGGRGGAVETLRVFLLTWDPFEWFPDRPPAFATSTRRPEGYGLVLYLSFWQALALADEDANGIAGVVGRFAESVLSVALDHEEMLVAGDYAAAVHAGTAPGLLGAVPAQASAGPPTIELVGPGWQDVQFDVLEDLAQDAFGPAELDRAPVDFTTAGDNRPGCPGCAGERLSFPDGIKDAQTTICPAHRAEALKVITARLEEAKASNPAGWEGLLEAGRRLEEPHLPLGLGPRLVAAAGVDDPTPAELGLAADLVLEAARMAAGRLDPVRALAGHATEVQAWLDELPPRLAEHGLEEQSAAVATAAVQLMSGEPEGAGPDLSEEPPRSLKPPKAEPIRRGPRVGRNAPCPCGSGRKYKFCHGQG